jgi:hypothetical protein
VCVIGPQLAQHDRVDVPAVIGLAPVGHAAVAVEALRIGIGAGAEIIDDALAAAGWQRKSSSDRNWRGNRCVGADMSTQNGVPPARTERV